MVGNINKPSGVSPAINNGTTRAYNFEAPAYQDSQVPATTDSFAPEWIAKNNVFDSMNANKDILSMGQKQLQAIDSLDIKTPEDLRTVIKELSYTTIDTAYLSPTNSHKQTEEALKTFSQDLNRLQSQAKQIPDAKAEDLQHLNTMVEDLQTDIARFQDGQVLQVLKYNHKHVRDMDDLANRMAADGVDYPNVRPFVESGVMQKDVLAYQELGLDINRFQGFLTSGLSASETQNFLLNFSDDEMLSYSREITAPDTAEALCSCNDPQMISDTIKNTKLRNNLIVDFNYKHGELSQKLTLGLEALGEDTANKNFYSPEYIMAKAFPNKSAQEAKNILNGHMANGLSPSEGIIKVLEEQVGPIETPKIKPPPVFEGMPNLTSAPSFDFSKLTPTMPELNQTAAETTEDIPESKLAQPKYDGFREYIERHQKEYPEKGSFLYSIKTSQNEIDTDKLDQLLAYGVDPQNLIYYMDRANINAINVNDVVMGEKDKGRLPDRINKFIDDNNIAFPDRYSSELLEVLTESKHSDQKDNAVIFITQDDAGRAFSTDSQDYLKLAQAYNLKIVEVEKDTDLMATLNQYPDQSVDLMIIAGHGSPSAITLSYGEDPAASHFDLWDEAISEQFTTKLSDKAQIVLNSCTTGDSSQFGHSLQQNLQEITGKKVFAPECSFSDLELQLDDNGHLISADFLNIAEDDHQNFIF